MLASLIKLICFLVCSQATMCSQVINVRIVYINTLQEVKLFGASSVGVSCQIPILTTRVRVPAGALLILFGDNSTFFFL